MRLNEQMEMTFDRPVATCIPRDRAVQEHPQAKWWFAYMRRIVRDAPSPEVARPTPLPRFADGSGFRTN